MKIFPRIANRLILILFITASASLTSTASAAETSVPLEVMTYNIRTGKAMDGLDAWPLRKSRTIKLLEKYKPELIGLQEAYSFQITDLLQAMPGYAVAGSGRADGRAGNEFSPIMYDTSRLQLLRSDTFWLSETPDTPGTTHWGNFIVRICTWAYFQDLKTGRFFYHFNTHLDHISQPSRKKSAALILERIKAMRPEDPVVVTGDFNAGEKNPVIQTMIDGNFRDSFRVLHPHEKIEGTTNAFQETRQPHKIDYVFIDKNWEVQDATIPDDKFDGRWPSDHLPVTAKLVLK